MKKFNFCVFTLFVLAGFIQNTFAQKQPPLDKSPLDVIYFPNGYTTAKKNGRDVGKLVARVVYSRPSKEGREIFGKLVEYGKVWRLGANESTEVQFFEPVKIDGKPVAPGRYSLFAIPQADKWIIVLNKGTDSWGAFTYDQSVDVLRVDVPVSAMESPFESFTMAFIKAESGFSLFMGWDAASVVLPISL
jgi:Protein of unknown function (DUF2911)